MKESTCIEDQLPNDTSDSQDLLQDMKAMNDKTPQVIKFTDHQSGEENTKILNTRKNVNTRHFLYKIDGTSLYILDKKSRTIAETYNIDSLQGDTLILSNLARPCETKVFVRVKS
jgi:predicted pyridoxine 5'-phosphate oxidase superfamily flavin-nucleotide-binding protein